MALAIGNRLSYCNIMAITSATMAHLETTYVCILDRIIYVFDIKLSFMVFKINMKVYRVYKVWLLCPVKNYYWLRLLCSSDMGKTLKSSAVRLQCFTCSSQLTRKRTYLSRSDYHVTIMPAITYPILIRHDFNLLFCSKAQTSRYKQS